MKRTAYLMTGLLVLSFALAGWLVGTLLLGGRDGRAAATPLPPAESQISETGEQSPLQQPSPHALTLSPQQLGEALNAILPEDFLLQDISLGMPEEGQLSVSATVERQRFADYLESRDALSAPIRAALALLPRQCPVEAVFAVSTDPEQGALLIVAQNITVAGWQLPQTLLDSFLFEELTLKINEALQDSQWFFHSIDFGEGRWQLLG